MNDFSEIKNKIQSEITADDGLSSAADSDLKLAIWSKISSCADTMKLPFDEKSKLASSIFSSMRGLDVLDELIADETITEIMVNGHDNIFCEKEGRLYRADCRFENDRKLVDIIQRIVGKTGREINNASPIVDTRLDDGSRVCAVLPPVALCGPVLNIRKFTRQPMTIERLIEFGSLSEEAAKALELFIVCGYNIFISGGTGSGKTSFLNALSDFIPPAERIVTVEDSAELNIKGVKNLVSLETRNANSSGNGKISISDLIRASLRMRPDRIIVGEVRGAEALDMLQAMNTGHDGSISTGHANSPEDMLLRLETMVLEARSGLTDDAVKRQISSAVDIIVHLSRMRDKSRKTLEITEVVGLKDGEFELNPLFVFREDTPDAPVVNGHLIRTENALIHREKLEKNGRGKEFT